LKHNEAVKSKAQDFILLTLFADAVALEKQKLCGILRRVHTQVLY